MYIGKSGQNFSCNLIGRHSRTGEFALNIGARVFFRPRVDVPIADIPSARDTATAISTLYRYVDQNITRIHFWKAGDLIVFDNQRYIHARFAQAKDYKRELVRVWYQIIEQKTEGDRSTASVEHATSSHETSMSAWIVKMSEVSESHARFALAMRHEEQTKVSRLAQLAKDIGLPIIESFDFKLPEQIQEFERIGQRIMASNWRLALRLSQDTGNILYRELDIDLDTALSVIRDVKTAEPFWVRLTPYRHPDRSGTLWCRKGDIVLELALGPHQWLTKASPNNELLLSCSYRFPHYSVQYSTTKTEHRYMLYSCLRDVVRLVLGCSIRDAASA